ncbi:phosphatidylinositol transfer protein PDR16 and related proteins, partial [Moesziomyces antarcticus T-34]
VDADTDKVISHDEAAASQVQNGNAQTNGSANGHANGGAQRSYKQATSGPTPGKTTGTDYRTEDASDRNSLKKNGSIKSAKSGFAKLKSVISPSKA